MGHLTCYTHSSRSMVLQNGDVRHRDGKSCDDQFVWFGKVAFQAKDVPTLGGLSTAVYLPPASMATKFSREKLTEAVKPFTEAMKNVGDALKKFTDAYVPKKHDPIVEGVMDYMLHRHDDIPTTVLPKLHLSPRTFTDRQRELLTTLFGDLEDVARDTTIGTGYITSTSEGISVDVVLIDELQNAIHEADMKNVQAIEQKMIHGEPDIREVKCPVCGEKAIQDRDQEDTIYCDNCSFMGMYPETSDHQIIEIDNG